MSDDFVELIGNMGAGLGLSKAACQLYALLYIKAKPLSLDAMSEELGTSKGNVSVNIRALERWGAVKKVWKKGSRKDYYRAEEDIGKIVLARLQEGAGKRVDALKDYIDKHKVGEDAKQLKKLEGHLGRTESLLKTLESFTK